SLHDRMPVIVRRDDYAIWLDPDMQDTNRLQPLFPPFPDTDFVMNAVSMRVNSPKFDDPDCIQETA
ncbi:MAG: SOS response-associated peptidase family protein, partial [Planctomycetes bacterium]|nr:SOS response-associated peptidase family protein [Planctomycetota bacterium]